jgi:hypothetical protein
MAAVAAGPGVSVGDELAGYSIEALLGRGGIGGRLPGSGPWFEQNVALKVLLPELSGRNAQISGVAAPAGSGECTEHSADLAITLTGDLVGCWYIWVHEAKFNASGTYQESGAEVFVGCLNGAACGTFGTTCIFRGKYADDTFAVEIHGRCLHWITAGTGTGGFAGVTGLVHFKDDVAAGNFPYTGHLSGYAG